MLKFSQRLFSTSRSVSSTTTPLVVKSSRIATSIILTRGPQITRDATPFEKAYFDYKEKQERQQSSVFPQDFYFKKGSVAERRWKEDVQARDNVMSDGSKSLSEAVEESQQRQQKQEENTQLNQQAIQLNSRITQADKEKDIKKLDRALQCNLYLIVKEKNQWQFPQTDIQNNEYLHEAAERHLNEACGKDMDVWFVGRQPISVFKQSPSRKEDTEGLKVFFMKARVYAGQVKPSKDITDFAWLTKEELVDYLPEDYYKAVKDSLGDL